MLQIVQETLNTARSDDFIARHRTSKTAFTRHRKLPFFDLLLFFLNQIKGSVQDELDAFMREGDSLLADKIAISKAAFTKARRHLKPTAFIELNQQLLTRIEAETPLSTWHGLRLLAVDGSKIHVPSTPEVLQHFGGQVNAYGVQPMALLSQCYDVLNQLSLDVDIQPYKTSERAIAHTHLQKITGSSLFLYDRGYAANWLMAAHYDAQQHFCMRMPTEAKYHCVRDFLDSDAVDSVVELRMQREALAQCHHYKITTRTFNIRLIKVVLTTGEIEVLATNLLDPDQYPRYEFQALYQKRWGVEEDYKQQKHSLKIELYSGKTVHAVLQDIHAKVLTKNLARLITLGAKERLDAINAQRKHTYKINFKQALSKTKFSLIKIVRAAQPEIWLEPLIDQIARCLEAVRPNRQFPRKRVVGSRCATYGTYKPIR